MCWFCGLPLSASDFFVGLGNFGLQTCFDRKLLFFSPPPPRLPLERLPCQYLSVAGSLRPQSWSHFMAVAQVFTVLLLHWVDDWSNYRAMGGQLSPWSQGFCLSISPAPPLLLDLLFTSRGQPTRDPRFQTVSLGPTLHFLNYFLVGFPSVCTLSITRFVLLHLFSVFQIISFSMTSLSFFS